MVVLIPKKDNPTYFREFRRITLSNVLYKLISKVLSNRLRPYLDNLISPLQSNFIPGRSIKDNAIVLREILHQMKEKKGKKDDLVFKLDLEKAYDMVSWDVLRETLVMFGFPETLVSFIMFSISSSSVSLIWNGRKIALRLEGACVKVIHSLLIYLSCTWKDLGL